MAKTQNEEISEFYIQKNKKKRLTPEKEKISEIISDISAPLILVLQRVKSKDEKRYQVMVSALFIAILVVSNETTDERFKVLNKVRTEIAKIEKEYNNESNI